jgi:hypothetical protein
MTMSFESYRRQTGDI